MKKIEADKLKLKEAREFLSGEKEEMSTTKKVIKDKSTGQISLRMPKDICIRKKIDENSEFEIILNPKEETWEELKKENLIIRLIKKK